MANIYDKVPVKVQKKSAFDKSHKNLFSSKVGTITPVMCDEVIPNSEVNLRIAITTQLPPLASDTFMNVKQKYAAFFVPTRLLMANYEDWLVGQTLRKGNTSSSSVNTIATPYYRFQPTGTGTAIDCLKPGTLADYLGFKVTKTDTGDASITSSNYINLCAFPFLAYHRIWNDWFRNSLVQTDIFNNQPSANYNAANSKVSTPYGGTNYMIANPITGTVPTSGSAYSAQSDKFVDGVHLWELRQANFGSDLYTACSPNPQNGAGQSVSFTVDTSTGNGEFTISALRAANAMQQFLERNNLAGNRLVDYVKAQYGANLNDAIAQRPILLGSGSFDVYTKGIYQTNQYAGSTETQNPFQDSCAAKFGSAFADGQDILIKGFTAQEPGYIMVLTWLSPKATYSTGISPILTRYTTVNSQSDMANPILQGVGDEPIYTYQLDSTAALNLGMADKKTVFGYNQRYANWKDMTDEVHGLLRDEGTLQSFALQKTFGVVDGVSYTPTLSTDFLEIPTNYLDQVSAVENTISDYGYWSDCYLDYKVSMPLARYSIPTLEDVGSEHGYDVVVDKGGKQLS
jgi:hypothetical protein